jgi:hypothetical protein
MTIFRDNEQAALAEINGWGNNLLLRYRELADIDARLQTDLHAIIDHRRELLRQVAACTLARDDLPTAEDQEMTQLKSLTDKFMDYFVGSDAMIMRVQDTETDWLNRLKELANLDWNPSERELLVQLQGDAEAAIQRLRALLEQ